MPERRIQAGHFSQDAAEFLRLLGHHGVRYLLIGGEAVIFYGNPRFTGDIDFFYSTEPENCSRLFQALQDFWRGPIPAVDESSDLEEPEMVFQFGVPPNRIDLLSAVSGIDFESAWLSRQETLLGDVIVPYVGLADLIASKRAAGRNKDLEDLLFLERLLKEGETGPPGR